MRQNNPLKKLSTVGEYQIRTKRRIKPEAKEHNYVYFVEAISTDRIKIGTSCKPTSRLSAMKTDCPYPIKVLLLIELPWQYETALHRIYAEYRLHGEWFEACPLILGFIARSLLHTDKEICDYLNKKYTEIIFGENGAFSTKRWGSTPKSVEGEMERIRRAGLGTDPIRWILDRAEKAGILTE